MVDPSFSLFQRISASAFELNKTRKDGFGPDGSIDVMALKLLPAKVKSKILISSVELLLKVIVSLSAE